MNLDKIQDCTLHRKTPFVIQPVIGTMFSVARFYGGAKYNGEEYTYLPNHDALVRDDVLKWLRKGENQAASSSGE